MDETRSRRVRRGVIGATALAWAALVAAWLDLLGGRAQDDLYILYRYAWNLAHGSGFVYNPGERVFGLSEPGTGLLLAGLHRVTGLEVPALGSLVFGLSLLALAVTLAVAADRRGRGPEALLGGTLLLAWSLVWASHGAGAPMLLALLAGAALVLESAPDGGRVRAGVAAGVLAGLAVWVRPDAAAGVAILAALAWRRDRRLPLAFAATSGVLIAAGAVAAWLYFGSVLPQTLEAKRTAVAAFTPGYGAGSFWAVGFDVFRRHAGSGSWLLLALGFTGSVPLWRRGGLAGRSLVAFAVVVAATYSGLKVGLLSWYLLPVVVALVYGFAFATGNLARLAAHAVRRRRSPEAGAPLPRLAASMVVLAVLLAAVVPLVRSSHRWAASFSGFGRLNAYRDAGEWIAATSPPGARVAALEIGVVGYYARRPLGDLFGLVSPESLPYVARRDLVGALSAQHADLVVARSRGRMRRVVESPWFRRTYREAIRFPIPGGRGWVAVYRLRAVDALSQRGDPGVAALTVGRACATINGPPGATGG